MGRRGNGGTEPEPGVRQCRRLRLRALDDEDLATLGGLLQDALVPLGDMAPLWDEQRFVGVVNRYRWETRPEDCPGERVLCAFAINGLKRVWVSGIDQHQPKHLLNLLAVVATDCSGNRQDSAPSSSRTHGDPSTAANRTAPHPHDVSLCLNLLFSGGGVIRLAVERIDMVIEDLGEPWPTQWRPQHDDSPAAG